VIHHGPVCGFLQEYSERSSERILRVRQCCARFEHVGRIDPVFVRVEGGTHEGSGRGFPRPHKGIEVGVSPVRPVAGQDATHLAKSGGRGDGKVRYPLANAQRSEFRNEGLPQNAQKQSVIVEHSHEWQHGHYCRGQCFDRCHAQGRTAVGHGVFDQWLLHPIAHSF
jgi:hypothetical protein